MLLMKMSKTETPVASALRLTSGLMSSSEIFSMTPTGQVEEYRHQGDGLQQVLELVGDWTEVHVQDGKQRGDYGTDTDLFQKIPMITLPLHGLILEGLIITQLKKFSFLIG